MARVCRTGMLPIWRDVKICCHAKSALHVKIHFTRIFVPANVILRSLCTCTLHHNVSITAIINGLHLNPSPQAADTAAALRTKAWYLPRSAPTWALKPFKLIRNNAPGHCARSLPHRGFETSTARLCRDHPFLSDGIATVWVGGCGVCAVLLQLHTPGWRGESSAFTIWVCRGYLLYVLWHAGRAASS